MWCAWHSISSSVWEIMETPFVDHRFPAVQRELK